MHQCMGYIWERAKDSRQILFNFGERWLNYCNLEKSIKIHKNLLGPSNPSGKPPGNLRAPPGTSGHLRAPPGASGHRSKTWRW